MTEDWNKLNQKLKEEIAKRKKIEDALRDSEAQYKALFDGSPDAILLLDPTTGIILDANPAASRLLARPYEAIVGLHQSNIHPPQKEIDSRNTFIRYVEESGERAESHPIEYTIYRPDGSEVPVEVLSQLVTIRGEKVLQGVFRDITERKRAEQALMKSEERLRQAIRVSHIGIFDHDHLTDTINWSPLLREVYGSSPDETITLSAFLNFVHPEDRERIALAVRQAHDPAGDGTFDVEHRIIRRDGTIRWLIARSKTFFDVLKDGSRRPIRTVGAVRDVTDSKKAEDERGVLQAQYAQAQKMESVGRLAGGVAHDFNNMLSVIRGHAEWVLRQIDPESPLRPDLLQIQAAAQRSADLTRQLLAFARKQTIVPQVLNLNNTVEGMLKMLSRLIGENVDVVWVPSIGIWPVRIDPVQIDQILANLLVNARDAIADKGRITIETQNVVLDDAYCAVHRGFKPGYFVMLTISDDGCGMDRPTLAHIFEPFFTTKGEGKGTGLGLATVYGIVKQNEGFINAYSEPGTGTTFKIYLPHCATTPVPDPAESLLQLAKGGVETILLVEDEPMILDLSKTLLENLGYAVLTANSPSEAIRVAADHAGEIHLLITDVVMPEMNGLDLAKRLLSLYPVIKSLLMSGYTANVIAHHGMLDEGILFMQKPFTVDELAAKVREALQIVRPGKNAEKV